MDLSPADIALRPQGCSRLIVFAKDSPESSLCSLAHHLLTGSPHSGDCDPAAGEDTRGTVMVFIFIFASNLASSRPVVPNKTALS